MSTLADREVQRQLAESLPQDLLFDFSTGDIAIVNGGFDTSKGIQSVAQALRIHLRFFLGEWFLDEGVGVPYFQQIFTKAPNLPLIESIFRSEILSVPGVGAIDSLNMLFDRASRRATVTFKVRTDWGELIADSLEIAR